MALLLVSIAVLWIAPLGYQLSRRYIKAHALVEKFALILIVGIIVLDIIPHAYYVIGIWAIVLAALGLLLPSFVERQWRRFAHDLHFIPLTLAIVGLALHASLDGAAFVAPNHIHFAGNHSLPHMVIIHRFFEGSFIWWSFRPKFGVKIAASMLAAISLFSLVGFAAGDAYFHTLDTDSIFAYFQAVVAGSLLHVAIDRHAHEHEHDQVHEHAHAD